MARPTIGPPIGTVSLRCCADRFPKTEFRKSEFWLKVVFKAQFLKTLFYPLRTGLKIQTIGNVDFLENHVILRAKPVKSQTTAMATIATRRTHH